MTEAGSLHWRQAGSAGLKGIAQVAFLDQPVHGVLVVVAIAMLSPWSAAAAVFGSTLAILVGRRWFGQSVWEWEAGFGAYDCALLGMAWGGALSRGWNMLLPMSLAMLACLALRGPLVRRLHSFALPALAAPALITTWLSVAAFAAFGDFFWVAPPLVPLVEMGPVIAMAAIAVGFFLKHPRAAAASLAVAGLSATLYGSVFGEPLSIRGASFWAFTVTPAVFALSGVFLPGFRSGWKTAFLAALISGALWLLWVGTPMLNHVPPLMAPLFIGIWCALAIILGQERLVCLDPGVQRAARQIAASRDMGGTLALTGAGVSTASGIPDYTSGQLLDPAVPLARYSFEAYLSDAGSRSLYWTSCARFRNVALAVTPNAGHLALAALEASAYVPSTITQNVDGLHQAAGTRQVMELHGNIFRVRCLACDEESAWPADNTWAQVTPSCSLCGGLLKPAVIAFGENIRVATWQQADSDARGCAAMLMVGSQLAVSSASALLTIVRDRGAPCIFVTVGEVGVPIFPNDTLIVLRAERALPALARLLDVSIPRLAPKSKMPS